MLDIEKVINSTKFTLAQILDDELYQPVKEELRQADVTHSLGIKKEMFKNCMEAVLDELKIELVRGIVEEALAKNKYEVLFLKLKSELIPIKPEQVLNGPQYGQTREVIDLQEGDIPISYQSYVSMFSCGSSSGPGAGGQQLVREVVVLRPVVEG